MRRLEYFTMDVKQKEGCYDYNCMLRRVGAFVDALLGDELLHPYRKNFAHNSTERIGAPSFVCKFHNIFNIVLTLKR